MPRRSDSSTTHLVVEEPTKRSKARKSSAKESTPNGLSNDIGSAEISGSDKLKGRQALSSRRQQSKSEPALVQDCMDGTQEVLGPDDSGDGALIAQDTAAVSQKLFQQLRSR